MWNKQKESKKKFDLSKVLVSEKKLQEVAGLYYGKTRVELRELLSKELIKKLIPIMLCSIGCIIVAVFLLLEEDMVSDIVKRPKPWETEVVKEFLLETEEGEQILELAILPQEYEQEEIEILHKTAQEYLDSVVLAENKDFSNIVTDLYFPSSLASTGGSIDWKTDCPWVISYDGTVCNEEVTEPTFVQITAEISYGSEYRMYTKTVTVIPNVYTNQEKLVYDATEQLQQLEQDSRTKEYIKLPEQILGYPLKQKEERGFGKESFLILLAVILPLLTYVQFFGNLQTLQEKRKEEAENSYSEFITKLSLLLAAGISIRQSFYRLGKEYEENYGETHVLTIELKIAKQELENGYSESVVYDAFGRRMGILSYQRMASLLTQNVSKGVQGIRALLLQEAKEVMAQERANIKIKGEQAGTKLLFPMMGLLLIVFAILLVPAFQSF